MVAMTCCLMLGRVQHTAQGPGANGQGGVHFSVPCCTVSDYGVGGGCNAACAIVCFVVVWIAQVLLIQKYC